MAASFASIKSEIMGRNLGEKVFRYEGVKSNFLSTN